MIADKMKAKIPMIQSNFRYFLFLRLTILQTPYAGSMISTMVIAPIKKMSISAVFQDDATRYFQIRVTSLLLLKNHMYSWVSITLNHPALNPTANNAHMRPLLMLELFYRASKGARG